MIGRRTAPLALALGCALGLALVGHSIWQQRLDSTLASKLSSNHKYRHERLDDIKLLVRQGAPPNTRGKDGETPLLWAARFGDAPFARELIRQGADPDASDSWGYTPLKQAAVSGSLEVVRVLIAAGADVNHKGQQDQDHTALEWALFRYQNEKEWSMDPSGAPGQHHPERYAEIIRLLKRAGARER